MNCNNCLQVKNENHVCADLPEAPDGHDACLGCGRRIGWGYGHSLCQTPRYIYSRKYRETLLKRLDPDLAEIEEYLNEGDLHGGQFWNATLSMYCRKLLNRAKREV